MRINMRYIIEHHQLNKKPDQCIFLANILNNITNKEYQQTIDIISDYLVNKLDVKNIFMYARWAKIFPDKIILEQIEKHKAYHQLDKSKLPPEVVIKFLIDHEYDTNVYYSLPKYTLFYGKNKVEFRENRVAYINSYYPTLNYIKYKKYCMNYDTVKENIIHRATCCSDIIYVGDTFYIPFKDKHVTVTAIEKVINDGINSGINIPVNRTESLNIVVNFYYQLYFDVTIEHQDIITSWFLKTIHSHTVNL